MEQALRIASLVALVLALLMLTASTAHAVLLRSHVSVMTEEIETSLPAITRGLLAVSPVMIILISAAIMAALVFKEVKIQSSLAALVVNVAAGMGVIVATVVYTASVLDAWFNLFQKL